VAHGVGHQLRKDQERIVADLGVDGLGAEVDHQLTSCDTRAAERHGQELHAPSLVVADRAITPGVPPAVPHQP